jgi:nucleotide-binding universal stress UspA family protein
MTSEEPVLLCYDGSEDAKHAIRTAASLLVPRSAMVLTVCEDIAGVPPFAWAAPMAGIEDFLAAARQGAHEVVNEGVGIAEEAGFVVTPLVVEVVGPAWPAILEAADAHAVSVIVLGSRGLGGLKSVLLGSVSGTVAHRARRPVLVISNAEA